MKGNSAKASDSDMTQLEKTFGVEYFIIPNSVYGAWDDEGLDNLIEEIESYR